MFGLLFITKVSKSHCSHSRTMNPSQTENLEINIFSPHFLLGFPTSLLSSIDSLSIVQLYKVYHEKSVVDTVSQTETDITGDIGDNKSIHCRQSISSVISTIYNNESVSIRYFDDMTAIDGENDSICNDSSIHCPHCIDHNIDNGIDDQTNKVDIEDNEESSDILHNLKNHEEDEEFSVLCDLKSYKTHRLSQIINNNSRSRGSLPINNACHDIYTCRLGEVDDSVVSATEGYKRDSVVSISKGYIRDSVVSLSKGYIDDKSETKQDKDKRINIVGDEDSIDEMEDFIDNFFKSACIRKYDSNDDMIMHKEDIEYDLNPLKLDIKHTIMTKQADYNNDQHPRDENRSKSSRAVQHDDFVSFKASTHLKMRNWMENVSCSQLT